MTTALTTVSFTAPDISCAHCVTTVKQAVAELDGVVSVDASAETKNVTVTFDPARAENARIREVLEEAGYPANS